MGRADYQAVGDWNVQCFQCGFKAKASQMVRNWQGFYVHPEHNEPRQTQDFVRGVPDNQTPPWTQPWPSVVYVYNASLIGFGDGVTTQFQAGSGLYLVSVTSVTVNGTSVTYTVNSTGMITLTAAPAKFAQVFFSGSETMP